MTIIGDSVSAALLAVPAAQTIVQRRYHVTYDLQVCRRLVDPSCEHDGVTPSTALDEIRTLGRRLGRVVVIVVGYNDDPARYRGGLDRVMRALVRAHVRTVVWLTMRDPAGFYAPANKAIRVAPHRWHRLRVADWAALSRDHPDWVHSDGLHLYEAGALAMARLIESRLPRP